TGQLFRHAAGSDCSVVCQRLNGFTAETQRTQRTFFLPLRSLRLCGETTHMTPTPTPDTFSRLSAALNSTDPYVQGLLHLIGGLVVLLVALVLARFGKQWVVRLLVRGKVNLNVATLLG